MLFYLFFGKNFYKVVGRGLLNFSLFQMERYVDKKLDKAGQLLKNGESRTKRWYQSICGDDTFRPKEIHFFLGSFAAGVALGVATSS